MSQPKSRRPAAARPQPQRLRGLARPAQLALSAMAGVLLVYAQAVAALGVGEPRYLSHLFEPLRVDIPVDTRGVDPATVEVGVAVSGVDARTAAAVGSRLSKEWRVDEHGGHVLRVTAPEAVHEPMLQLKVQVGDQRISTERELTLMFDPAPMPGSPETAIAAAEPAAITAVPVPALSVAPVAAVIGTIDPATPVAAGIGSEREAASITAAESDFSAEVEAAAVLSAIEAELEAEFIAERDAAVATPAAADRAQPAITVATASVLAPAVPTTVTSAQIASVRPATATPRAAPRVVSPAAPATVAVPASLPRSASTSASVLPPPAAAPIAFARVATLPPAALTPITSLNPMPVVGSEPPLTAAQREALVASTLEPRALSAIDRWQRVRVVEGDTLEQLAMRVRGEHDSIPLPMVAMLLRWLNPRSFEHAIGKPLPGAELRFPKAESLAAQIAVSGGVWTVADVTTSGAGEASAVVPPPSFQLLTTLSAESMDRALQAATSDGSDRDAAAGAAIAALGAGLAPVGRPTPSVAGNPALRLSGGLVGGAAVAGMLSMLLMLNMVVRTPTPTSARALNGTGEVRQPAKVRAAARELPAESLDLAALDLGRVADPVVHRRDAGPEHADS